MTTVVATLTEIRKDFMQKWENESFPKDSHLRYIWINPYQSKAGVQVGCKAKLVFHNGTGGACGGHWALWRVTEVITVS